jgi:hypothetical protein
MAVSKTITGAPTAMLASMTRPSLSTVRSSSRLSAADVL